MDGRRRRWFACDASANLGKTGQALYDEFGGKGQLVWLSMLQLAKRSPVEGVITYVSEEDLLVQLGLPGMALVDEAGDKWEVDALMRRLGQLKQTTRRRRGRAQEVALTHWQDWQDVKARHGQDKGNPTSGVINMDELPPESVRDTAEIGAVTTTVTSTKTSSSEDEEIKQEVERRLAKRIETLGPPDDERKWRRTVTADVVAGGVMKSGSTRKPDPLESKAEADAWKRDLDDQRRENPCPVCDGDKMLPDDEGDYYPCDACHATGVAA